VLHTRLLTIAVLAASLAACGSSELSVTTPSSPKCQVTASNSTGAIPAGGGTGSVSVTTTRDCTWAASSAASWVSITAGDKGQGNGQVSYRVAPNTDPSTRTAAINVNDAKVDVSQEAAPCRFSVSPAAVNAGAEGGSAAIAVTASSSACGWTAETREGWIHLGSASGRGSGSVTLQIDANAGEPRGGAVVIGGETVTVTQGAAAPAPPAACTYAISPASLSFAAAGGSGTFNVTAGATCVWTAVSNANWISIVGTPGGTGNGAVELRVAANTGVSRTATVTVAGQTSTVTQAAGCSYAIDPTSQNVGAGGGSVGVRVTAGSSCAWTAAPDVPWISITAGASGAGDGFVSMSVSPNPGAARTGTASIAGYAFTVSQAAAPCGYSINPTSQTVGAAGGNGTIAVTASGSCAWTATSAAAWVMITSSASGAGNGSVAFSVAANVAGARTTTIAIAGLTFTVNQDAAAPPPPPPPPPCSFSISPTSQTVPATGGSGTVMLTTGTGCAWTASTAAAWLAVSPSSGTGSGTVSFMAAANTGTARSGTIAIADQTFTVTQPAP
jgi:hypothetical protein